MKDKHSIPIIKENRISKLVDALNCFDKYPYNREEQRNCILSLYPGKSEKSVFRGMIIPSLRYLDLIVGYEDFIRPSANGKLMLEASRKNDNEVIKVTAILMLELDYKKFHFIQRVNEIIDLKKPLSTLIEDINGPSEKQKNERVNKWLDILEECKLIKFRDYKYIMLEKENIGQAELELKIIPQKEDIFKKILFEKYISLPYSETAGIVDIVILRELVAMEFYEKYKFILTESQFDELLSRIQYVTDNYIISFGHPMGAEEKLFYSNGEYYRTLNIRFFETETDEDGKK